jgi:hypothetical protein
VLPHEIQEKLHFSEKEYFKNHSTAIKSYISEMDIDLTVVWIFLIGMDFPYLMSIPYEDETQISK